MKNDVEEETRNLILPTCSASSARRIGPLRCTGRTARLFVCAHTQVFVSTLGAPQSGVARADAPASRGSALVLVAQPSALTLPKAAPTF